MIIPFALIIASHLLLSSPISHVSADRTLMARTCDRSMHSDYCDACFDSMKGLTTHQDLRGLGGSAIYCAFRKFMEAHGTIEKYYSKTDGVQCRDCMDQFDSAIEQVMEGMRMWRESRYADSKAQLKSAANQLFFCGVCWTNLTPSYEEQLLIGQLVHSDGYIDAAHGVIRQLLPDYDPNIPPHRI